MSSVESGTADCSALLQWACPRMGLRWSAFRRVKRQVCRRVAGRIRELGLPDTRAYAELLDREPNEWARLEALCGVTISRFYRDQAVFDCLAQQVLPELARRLAPGDTLQVWSAGCASGEEAYTIALIWELLVAQQAPGLKLRVLATDRDAHLLARATRGVYRRSSLRELPATWVTRSFAQQGDDFCLAPELRRSVSFERQDIRRQLPSEKFDLILCRNLVFSYFERSEQCAVFERFIERLRPHGHLAIGLHEQLPSDEPRLRQRPESEYIFQLLPPA